jgi:protein-tyrosine phosphatase
MQMFNMWHGLLWQSPAIDQWEPAAARKVQAVIDLEGGLDAAIPQNANTVLYVYWPINDAPLLPDLMQLNDVAQLGHHLLMQHFPLLVHCGAGINRASLITGVILRKSTALRGPDIVDWVRARRPGALSNGVFEEYLKSLM